MNCLFVHDFRSFNKDGEVYTGNMSYEIWKERYIKYFDHVKVLNRTEQLSAADDANRYVKASGPNIEFINEIDVFTPISFVKNYGRYQKIVRRYVDEAEYVIIRLDSFLGLIAAKRCREKNKRYLIEVVGCVWDSFWNKGLYGKIVAHPLFKLMQKEVKLAPYVVYVTEKFLQNRYPTKGKSTNISNVLLPKHDDVVLAKRIARINNLYEEKNPILHIVSVASVSVRYKGQDSVIRAIGKLKKSGLTNFRYYLIGNGDQSYLRKIVKENDVEQQVIFCGGMKHDDVMAFLDNCDIYIQPSKQEGLPRALIEGMSRGMLCFGTNIAGIPELIDSEFLFSTKANNYVELAKFLEMITEDLCVIQAKRNFEYAQKYEKDVLAQRRESFFYDFINGN